MILPDRQQRGLLLTLIAREFSGRYQGSAGGLLWAIGQPLFLLLIYTLAFGVVLQTRWTPAGDAREYALILFAGLLVYNLFTECLKQASTLVTARPNFVKKIVFPLEILPWVMVGTAMLHAALCVGVWLLGYLVLTGWPPLTGLAFPLVLLAFTPLLLGIGWLLAALGVFLRDIDQFCQMLGHALLFATPIFYREDIIPAGLRWLMQLNPLTFIVSQSRQVLYQGQWPDWLGLLQYAVLATLFALAARWLFRRLRPLFADQV